MKRPLRATNVRPDTATLIYSFSLFKNKRAIWILNGAAFILVILFGMLFSQYVSQNHPGYTFELVITSANGLYVFLSLTGIAVGQLVLHELVHGAFFWLFSRSRPTFGFRGWYAFASAPGWFFPRLQYLVITLAPFVVLSVLGLVLLAILHEGEALIAILFAVTLNAASAVGDLWITFLILRERRAILIEDTGDGSNFYALS